MTGYIVSWAFQLALVLVLVFSAKARARSCQWSLSKAETKLLWGISIVVIVQICEFVEEATSDHGVGLLYHIQWIGVYWIALAVYRRKYLRSSPANATMTAAEPQV
jgi:hypothetical protein